MSPTPTSRQAPPAARIPSASAPIPLALSGSSARDAKSPSTYPSLHQSLALLGGLSATQFMRRHWQKKPLLIRQAIAQLQPLQDRAGWFAMAEREGVESRLVVQKGDGQWSLRHGPFLRRQLPPASRAGWTLLLQGMDLHLPAAHALMQRFRFLPDARLDDLMVSWASDGGGVGPHFDSYDVFLLQATGQRRWRIGRQKDLSLQPGVPLKILQHFEPEQEFVLEPGDMLYLPPRWAHDGVAVGGDCTTYSIGFRAPQRGGLAAELAQRMLDHYGEDADDGEDAEDGGGTGNPDPVLYKDPTQPATDTPAAIPPALVSFARDGLQRLLQQPLALECALGEVLTEPKPSVVFEAGELPMPWPPQAGLAAGPEAPGLVLDRRTRMMYDSHHIFINGEAFRAGGADARLMRKLADQRRLTARDLARASEGALALLGDWLEAGWVELGAVSLTP
jgi:50S ribosomal protein L16 3-hydroxylase